MKKEELLEIGLTEEQANKVFAMNGTDVEREKAKTTAAKADLADAQEKLSQRDKDLEELKRSTGDVEAVKKQLEELQTKYTAETEQYKAQLEARDYTDAIARGISGKNLKFSSKSAREAFEARLRDKKLEIKDGELAGLDEFIKAQREADPDAFAPEKPAPKFTGPNGGGHVDPPEDVPENVAIAKAMGSARAAGLKASNDVMQHYL